MRLISRELANSFDVSQPINFSLYFNKMLTYHDNFSYRDIERKNGNEREKGIKESFKPCEGEINGKRFRDEQYGPYRQHNLVYKQSKEKMERILRHRHIHQAAYCKAMEQAGWKSIIIHAKLTSPFVSGLGMAHPTETGLVLDHTSGCPYIPASSQKGVLRLAHIINSMMDDKEVEDKDTKEVKYCWQEDDVSKTIFGYSEKQNSLAGQLVVLDAYPLKPPELGEEILNPHFIEYYGGKRGPTEDQDPIPVKFLVVKAGAEFVFRLLLRLPFGKALEKDQDKLVKLIKNNLIRAITEEGMGAKTSIGFGRFFVSEGVSEGEPPEVQKWFEEYEKQREQKLFPWRPLLKKIEEAKDWGQLKQLMENSALLEYQANKEIGAALKNAADEIRKNNAQKWTADRDKLVSDWLKPSSVDWEILQKEQQVADAAITQEEQADVEKIKKMSDWGAWKSAKMDMSALSLSALDVLKKRFEEWGCNNKKAKSDKRDAWKQLQSILREKHSDKTK
ncbi:MAG: type III-B CRISPR module RAMP protein Cmr6 [Dissulfuribacterales bacterium]